MNIEKSSHYPVMLKHVLEYLAPKDGEVYVDGTFGAGGYSRAILQSANCKLYAIDRDPNVVPTAEKLKEEFPDKIELLQGKFGQMEDLLGAVGVEKVDGIVLDIGVSSMQIDQAERGFSFSRNGNLDMRMSSEGVDAAYLVNNMPEQELADIIYTYGGERKSRRVARAIIEARKEGPITTTLQLANIVRSVVRKAKDKIDPATRTFQAIRIWVNDELGELERALAASERILKVGGRIIVVSFHSLEDSIVKKFFNEKAGKGKSVSRHAIAYLPLENENKPAFEIITRKVVKPSCDEIDENIRSRSARLRAARKNDEGEGV